MGAFPPSLTDFPLPKPPRALDDGQKQAYKESIKQRLVKENAVLVAHYYTDPEIQALAEESGGCVADSLEMARFGHQHPASTLVVAGVKFMGETAKILTPEKRVIMPTLEATCSLDLGCEAGQFADFIRSHPDREVVVYANTSAAVKAQADWVVTSSIAVDVVEHLDTEGKKILWAPDKHLGHYVQKQTGADVVCWDSACIVHDEFKTDALRQTRALYPDAAVFVHPESPASVIALADVVGSTSQLINAAKKTDKNKIIVATDKGIFYKMQKAAPDKELIIAPTAGEGATCRSCAHCPWMKMNQLDVLSQVFDQDDNEIFVEEALRVKALMPLERMLNFNRRS